MIVFSIEPSRGWVDLRDDFLALVMFLLDLGCDPPGDLFLFRRMIENCRAVLSSSVGALGVQGGGIVHPVEEFDEGGIIDFFGGCVFDLESFCVVCVS